MSRTHAHYSSSIHLSSLPTKPLLLFPRFFLDQHKYDRFQSNVGYTLLVTDWFTQLCGRANGNGQVVPAFLLVHSVLWASQQELTRLAFPSYFLYKPKFWQPDTSACYMIHASFLLSVFFNPEDGGDMLLRKVGWLSADYTALYPRRYNSSMQVIFMTHNPIHELTNYLFKLKYIKVIIT
jgi:hypothetical protein